MISEDGEGDSETKEMTLELGTGETYPQQDKLTLGTQEYCCTIGMRLFYVMLVINYRFETVIIIKLNDSIEQNITYNICNI